MNKPDIKAASTASRPKMRDLRFIVVHTSASWQTNTAQDILDYEHNVLKWKNPGYHVIIDAKGIIHKVHPLDQVANGVGGVYNLHGLHVAWIGGIRNAKDPWGNTVLQPCDNRTKEQKESLIEVVKEWHDLFPKAEILGHRDIYHKYGYKPANKACPCFNVAPWLVEIGIK